MNWILVIYIYAGVLANGDSVAITNIPNFATKQDCIQAGEDAKGLTQGSAKVYRFVCLKKAQEK
jgi:hypothetical protein